MSTLWVRHLASSAAEARHTVRNAFSQAGLDDETASDAALIASELVTNAVRHAQPLPSGHLAVEWTFGPDGYRIAVTDGGGGSTIAPRQAGHDDPSGRGLQIVASLSDDWGVIANPTGTTVWARGRDHAHLQQA